jgi:hypothetical protein
VTILTFGALFLAKNPTPETNAIRFKANLTQGPNDRHKCDTRSVAHPEWVASVRVDGECREDTTCGDG